MKIETIGIIGLGEMGLLYARHFSRAGFRIFACDRPDKYKDILDITSCIPNLSIQKDGYGVVRQSDLILFSVEAENIERLVEIYGPAVKVGAVVGGQTSVKEREVRAFEKYLPDDVFIITCHSMHGPSVDPVGQPLVVMRCRCSDDYVYKETCRVLSSLGSNITELTWQEHDRITADTQAVTHLAFLSMGTTWHDTGVFPWLDSTYTGGIENVKVMTTLRIYGGKWHVYAGLAIMNPSARTQIKQYARSVADLFKLMIQEKSDAFRRRVYEAGSFVFGITPPPDVPIQPHRRSSFSSDPILLSDDFLDRFSLGSVPKNERKPNSHLSLLAIVDCWYQLKLSPYESMMCQTPPFRLWLGITEYLFKTREMLENAISTALFDKSIRADDLAFLNATQAWAQTILLGSMDGYRERFEKTAKFFEGQLGEAKEMSAKMVKMVSERSQGRTLT